MIGKPVAGVRELVRVEPVLPVATYVRRAVCNELSRMELAVALSLADRANCSHILRSSTSIGSPRTLPEPH